MDRHVGADTLLKSWPFALIKKSFSTKSGVICTNATKAGLIFMKVQTSQCLFDFSANNRLIAAIFDSFGYHHRWHKQPIIPMAFTLPSHILLARNIERKSKNNQTRSKYLSWTKSSFLLFFLFRIFLSISLSYSRFQEYFLILNTATQPKRYCWSGCL